MKKRKIKKLNTNIFFGFLAFAAFVMFLVSFLFNGVGKTVFLSISALFAALIPLFDFMEKRSAGYISFNPLLYILAALLSFIFIDAYQGLLLLLFYAIGIAVKEWTAHSKINAEYAMQEIQQKKYHIYVHGTRQVKEARDIKINDRVELLSGEILPVDGMVVSGEAMVSVSEIDGTSRVHNVHAGERLTAGITVLSGSVIICASTDLQDSTIAKMIGYKTCLLGTLTHHEKSVIKIVNIITAVVGIAGIVWFSVAGIQAKQLYPAMQGIVWMCFICSTDAFRSLLHTAYLNAAVRCSNNGIVVKNKRLVEKSMYIKNLLFRKQGVLTTRTPVISKIIPIDGVSENELITFAVYAQYKATHPISAELRNDYGKRVKTAEISYFMETEDNGAMVQLQNGIEIITGNSKVLNDYGIVTGIISEESVLCVAVNNVFIGHIVFEYEIKEDIRQYVDSLKYAGAKNLSIVTKDSERAAKAIAAKSGIKRYYSDLSKTELEQTVNSFGKNTVYIGYGKGDAYAFGDECAKLMYGGFQYDNPTTDGLLLSDHLGSVLKFFNIIKDTRHLVLQNLVLSLLIVAAIVWTAVSAGWAVWAGGLFVITGALLNGANGYRMCKKL